MRKVIPEFPDYLINQKGEVFSPYVRPFAGGYKWQYKDV